MNLIHNYVYTKVLDLDSNKIKNSCLELKTFINETIIDDGTGFDGKTQKGKVPPEAKLFSQYNLFMYPLPGFHELYKQIQENFHFANAHQNGESIKNVKYYTQCWLNIYRAGDYIDWHYHWLPEVKAWHGFYCVDVEPLSETSYRIPGKKDIHIRSENNLLVISKSDGDLHKSSEWHDKDRPRITIAFDIIPEEKLYDGFYNKKINHWVPI